MFWSKEDLDALERILLRTRASALAERTASMRLQGAYSHRPAIVGRVDEADRLYNEADRLLAKLREERLLR